MDLRIRDDLALVVGGSDGIGLATAKALAEDGARVTIASRDATALAEVAAANGLDHLPCDATDAASVEALVQTWEKRYQKLDILIMAVGGSHRSAFEALADEQWRQNWEFNILATVRVVRGLLPALRRAGGARVVLFGAAGARMPYAEQIVSNVHKAGHIALVKTLAAELIPEGIRVNAVSPGRTITRLWRNRAATMAKAEGTTPDAILTRFAADIPLGRFGAAEEIADVAAFLASPRSSYVVGQSVAVDGGIGRGLL
ncbi:SDR family oxidoreductase [Roseomonas stagni]|uniref:SDR family oxidoreductase n=1 Tax=Falsiroseomonas algicola TaxID=2716930 RepID=A0A6M1LEE4_9PROT|nr:SDR family oxidoreductase [Falsiroseomonas algicola]NGM18655.1 SDR family oxidoreductase [Falsiroseomonas algicola]